MDIIKKKKTEMPDHPYSSYQSFICQNLKTKTEPLSPVSDFKKNHNGKLKAFLKIAIFFIVFSATPTLESFI